MHNGDDEIFHGRLELIHGLVTDEIADAKSLKRAFHAAVDDYLELCEAEGGKPDKPLKGRFNVRPGRDPDRRPMVLAAARDLT